MLFALSQGAMLELERVRKSSKQEIAVGDANDAPPPRRSVSSTLPDARLSVEFIHRSVSTGEAIKQRKLSGMPVDEDRTAGKGSPKERAAAAVTATTGAAAPVGGGSEQRGTAAVAVAAERRASQNNFSPMSGTSRYSAIAVTYPPM